jgi:Family of unknown function (DUF6272)
MTDSATASGAPDREQLERTRIGAMFTIRPVGNIVGDVAGLFAESLQTLLGMFYPPGVCKKANVVVTELVQNVVENIADRESGMQVELGIDGDTLSVVCSNKATAEQAENVRKRLSQLSDPKEARRLLAETIRARRPERLKGGLGFMRLVSENKFKLSTQYEGGLLTVRAEYSMKGIA